MSTNCWQGNGVDKSFMSESSLPGLCSAPWGAGGGSGRALVSAEEEEAGASRLVRMAGSWKVSIYHGSNCLTWRCPVCVGQTHPTCTSCSEKLGATKVQSSFLFPLFPVSGKVLHADLGLFD